MYMQSQHPPEARTAIRSSIFLHAPHTLAHFFTLQFRYLLVGHAPRVWHDRQVVLTPNGSSADAPATARRCRACLRVGASF